MFETAPKFAFTIGYDAANKCITRIRIDEKSDPTQPLVWFDGLSGLNKFICQVNLSDILRYLFGVTDTE